MAACYEPITGVTGSPSVICRASAAGTAVLLGSLWESPTREVKSAGEHASSSERFGYQKKVYDGNLPPARALMPSQYQCRGTR